MMHIGLFGGTFNPVHIGHLSAARQVKKRFCLDKIYIIPAAIPPHKEPAHIVDAADRSEMIRLAVLNNPDLMDFVEVSDVELRRKGTSFTIDTVSYFATILPEKTEFYFILGCDAFLEIHTWKAYAELFERVSFVVMSRPHVQHLSTDAMWETCEKYLKHRISNSYQRSDDKACFTHEKKKPVYFFNVTPMDISSTMIRHYVRLKKDICPFVNEHVEQYIKKKGLYL